MKIEEWKKLDVLFNYEADKNIKYRYWYEDKMLKIWSDDEEYFVKEYEKVKWEVHGEVNYELEVQGDWVFKTFDEVIDKCKEIVKRWE